MAIAADAIRAVIAAESGVEEARLIDTATLAELDIGSLDVVSVLFELEDRFGVVIEPDRIAADSTVGGFIAHVQSLAAEVSPS